MKKIVYNFFLLVGLLIAASCSREPLNSINFRNKSLKHLLVLQKLPNKSMIPLKIKVLSIGKKDSDALIWSAALEGQNILAVGYGTESFRNQPSDLNQTKQSILNLIAELEGKKSRRIIGL